MHRSEAEPVCNIGPRRMLVVSTRILMFCLRETLGTYCTIWDWVGHAAGLKGTENLRRTGIRLPNFPNISERLY